MIEEFHSGAYRFLEEDMSLDDKIIEEKKSEFLKSLLTFLSFAENNFYHTRNSPSSSKFMGGSTELEIMNNPAYKEREEEYLEKAKEMYEKWMDFRRELKEKYPNYVWE